jgi:hypothetical protein
MINQQEYDAYKEAFAKGNDELDVCFWACNTADEEESRLVEFYKEEGKAYIDKFPAEIRADVERLIKDISAHYSDHLAGQHTGPLLNLRNFGPTVPDTDIYDALDEMCELLQPHISNVDLWVKDQALWENLLFANSYQDFVDMCDDGSGEERVA